MAQCISPFYKKETQMSFPCGKCYPCKQRRISGWSFRLSKEAERSDSALFITLTYAPEHITMTKNNFMTLVKKDLQLFFKRLRINTERSTKNTIWDRKIKYYACGEYGGEFNRPHYHIILYNAEYHNIEESWKLGSIHYGELTAQSAAYTLKYISKDSTKKHANDDRQPEFSLMSKKLGDNYLTPNVIKWHKAGSYGSTERYFLTKDGKKLAIPRYYKQKIWEKVELQLIGAKFVKKQDEVHQNMNHAQNLEFSEKEHKMREYYSHINKDDRYQTLQ